MNPISETLRIVEWRALVTQYPTAFTWDGDSYTGRIADARDFGLESVTGGFVQDQGPMSLFCLREIFTDGSPGEGDILQINGLGWRVSRIRLVMSFGIVFDLEGPDRR